jgi:hypothetical protein
MIPPRDSREAPISFAGTTFEEPSRRYDILMGEPMPLGSKGIVLLASVVFAAGASTAHAQESSWRLGASLTRMDYDLSGTGHAPALAVRAERDLWSNVSLEVGGTYAKPSQQFGASTLFMPEVQLHYNWTAGRVSPYAGGGIGTALRKAPFLTDWDPTLSAAGGAAVRLTDRLSLTGELRLRGHERQFAGTTTELGVGLAWRIPTSF